MGFKLNFAVQAMWVYLAEALKQYVKISRDLDRIEGFVYASLYCLERNIYNQLLTESKTQPINFLSSSIFLRRTG